MVHFSENAGLERGEGVEHEAVRAVREERAARASAGHFSEKRRFKRRILVKNGALSGAF